MDGYFNDFVVSGSKYDIGWILHAHMRSTVDNPIHGCRTFCLLYDDGVLRDVLAMRNIGGIGCVWATNDLGDVPADVQAAVYAAVDRWD